MKPEVISLEGALLHYYPSLWESEEALSLFKKLRKETAWEARKIKVFGKEHMQPRLTAWYGDEGKSYSYSGMDWKPKSWNASLDQIKNQVIALSGHSFNSVLLNLYRYGKDSMGWHSDDEPELGSNPVIASVSLGAVRRFRLRHRHDKTIRSESIDLQDGSLLLMLGETQLNWQHALPKTSREVGERINLTFRWID